MIQEFNYGGGKYRLIHNPPSSYWVIDALIHDEWMLIWNKTGSDIYNYDVILPKIVNLYVNSGCEIEFQTFMDSIHG